MKKTFLWTVFLIFIFTTSMTFAQERISSMKIDIEFSENGYIEVNELITFDIKNTVDELVRHIPVHFLGYNYGIEDVSVEEAVTGKKLNYKFIEGFDEKNIAISLSNTFVGSVRLKYRIKFYDTYENSTLHMLTQIGESKWKSYIPLMQFRIKFPDVYKVKEEDFSFFFHDDRSDSIDRIKLIYSDNTILGEINYLYPYQSVIMQSHLPKEIFNNLKQPVKWYLFPIIFSVFATMIFLLFLYFQNRKKPFYKAKKHIYDISSINILEVDAVVRKKFKHIDVFALIIDWHNKGYVDINKNISGYTVERKLMELPQDSDEFEKYLFEKIFFKDTSSFMDLSFDEYEKKQVSDVKQAIKDQLNIEKNKFNNSQIIPIIIQFLVVGFMSIFIGYNFHLQMGINIIFSIAIIFILSSLTSLFINRLYYQTQTNRQKIYKTLIVTLYYLLVLGIYTYLSQYGISGISNIDEVFNASILFSLRWNQLIFIGFILSTILGAMLLAIRRDAPRYVEKLKKIYGHKDFLHSAKASDINSISFDIDNYYRKMIAYSSIYLNFENWMKLKENLREDTEDKIDYQDFYMFIKTKGLD